MKSEDLWIGRKLAGRNSWCPDLTGVWSSMVEGRRPGGGLLPLVLLIFLSACPISPAPFSSQVLPILVLPGLCLSVLLRKGTLLVPCPLMPIEVTGFHFLSLVSDQGLDGFSTMEVLDQRKAAVQVEGISTLCSPKPQREFFHSSRILWHLPYDFYFVDLSPFLAKYLEL